MDERIEVEKWSSVIWVKVLFTEISSVCFLPLEYAEKHGKSAKLLNALLMKK